VTAIWPNCSGIATGKNGGAARCRRIFPGRPDDLREGARRRAGGAAGTAGGRRRKGSPHGRGASKVRAESHALSDRVAVLFHGKIIGRDRPARPAAARRRCAPNRTPSPAASRSCSTARSLVETARHGQPRRAVRRAASPWRAARRRGMR
jgi:hypothetical protein